MAEDAPEPRSGGRYLITMELAKRRADLSEEAGNTIVLGAERKRFFEAEVVARGGARRGTRLQKADLGLLGVEVEEPAEAGDEAGGLAASAARQTRSATASHRSASRGTGARDGDAEGDLVPSEGDGGGGDGPDGRDGSGAVRLEFNDVNGASGQRAAPAGESRSIGSRARRPPSFRSVEEVRYQTRGLP